MLRRLQQLDVEQAAQQSVANTVEEVLQYNLEQMMEGKRQDGEDISPSYLDDPYFKSKEAAQRYSDWKDEITPNPKRKKGIPNLYIVGAFHGSIRATVSGGIIKFDSSFPEAEEIEAKFDKIYGLNAEKRTVYIAEHLRPELMKNVRNKLSK